MLERLRRLLRLRRVGQSRDAAVARRRRVAPGESRRAAWRTSSRAEWLWRSRIAGQSPPVAVWPKLSPASAARASSERLEGEWRLLLDGLSEAELARPVSYVNSKGEPWRSRVERRPDARRDAFGLPSRPDRFGPARRGLRAGLHRLHPRRPAASRLRRNPRCAESSASSRRAAESPGRRFRTRDGRLYHRGPDGQRPVDRRPRPGRSRATPGSPSST